MSLRIYMVFMTVVKRNISKMNYFKHNIIQFFFLNNIIIYITEKHTQIIFIFYKYVVVQIKK